jgi:hypothetical protein
VPLTVQQSQVQGGEIVRVPNVEFSNLLPLNQDFDLVPSRRCDRELRLRNRGYFAPAQRLLQTAPGTGWRAQRHRPSLRLCAAVCHDKVETSR